LVSEKSLRILFNRLFNSSLNHGNFDGALCDRQTLRPDMMCPCYGVFVQLPSNGKQTSFGSAESKFANAADSTFREMLMAQASRTCAAMTSCTKIIHRIASCTRH
jgi:hypothetical protein